MRIAYVPNSYNLLHAADRRRFVHFANQEKISFEKFNKSKHFDLIIVTIAANFYEILFYKKKYPSVKIIFDYCDDLLSDSFFKKLIRPLYECFKWKSIKNFRSFDNLVKEVLHISDAIICGSVEQKSNLSFYNTSIFVIPDFVINETFFKKDDFKLLNDKKINILWEGLSGGLKIIIEDLCKYIQNLDTNISLNIVTDSDTYLIGDRYIKIQTKSYLQKMSKKYGIEIKFWDWSINNLNKAVKCSDIGLIYIPKYNKSMNNKPENKLVLLSSFRLPTIVSSTPSYRRYIYSAGGEELHSLLTDFTKSNVKNLFKNENLRSNIGNSLYNYALKEYTEEKILIKWKNIFQVFLS